MDDLPDGRLVVIATRLTDAGDFSGAAELHVETSPSTGDFGYLGDLPLSVNDTIWFNPGGFLKVSRNTSGTVRLAVGNSNQSVGVLAVSDLVIPQNPPQGSTVFPGNITWFQPDASLFLASAGWLDDRLLAIGSGTFGQPSQINLLDTNSLPPTPDRSLIINNVQGANGGIVFDVANNLYVGNGFANGNGSSTGVIKRFEFADWDVARTGAPLDFEDANNPPITTILSAGRLHFDTDGSLIVGGGDNFTVDGEDNFLAMVDLSEANRPRRQFDPDTGAADNAYSLIYHDASGRIYAWDNFGSDSQQVYAFAVVPEPSSVTLTVLAILAALTIGRVRGAEFGM